jgi:hypothetical protein
MRVARILSIVFHPLPTAGYLLLAMTALDATSFWSGVGWAAVALALCVGGPGVTLWFAVRARRVADYHLKLREQRPRVLATSLGFAALAFAVLLVAHGPRGLVVALAVGLVNGVILTLITLGWKISLHVATMTGALAVLWWRLGPWVVTLVLVVLALAWARVALRRHTVSQVATGVIITAAVSAGVIVAVQALF